MLAKQQKKRLQQTTSQGRLHLKQAMETKTEIKTGGQGDGAGAAGAANIIAAPCHFKSTSELFPIVGRCR
jgi:hypothetical protein